MKHKFLTLIATILIVMPLTSCYNAPSHDIVVYKTSSGAKYHTTNCRYVKSNAIEINLSRAIYDGLEPCKVCHPPTKEDLDTLNK